MTFTQIPAHARVVGEQRRSLGRQLAERYEAGASLRELAAELGRSYGFVHRVLSETDAEMRSRGGARPGPRKRVVH